MLNRKARCMNTALIEQRQQSQRIVVKILFDDMGLFAGRSDKTSSRGSSRDL